MNTSTFEVQNAVLALILEYQRLERRSDSKHKPVALPCSPTTPDRRVEQESVNLLKSSAWATAGGKERKEKHPQPTVGGAQIAAKAWGIAKHPLWTDCSASTITSPDACSKSGSAAQKPSGAMKYGLTLAFGAVKDRSG